MWVNLDETEVARLMAGTDASGNNAPLLAYLMARYVHYAELDADPRYLETAKGEYHSDGDWEFYDDSVVSVSGRRRNLRHGVEVDIEWPD